MKFGEESGAAKAPEMARKTICIDDDVLRDGLARAAEEDRSFSNYVQWLIRRDVGEEKSTPEPREAVDG
jgi:hypothetical protein